MGELWQIGDGSRRSRFRKRTFRRWALPAIATGILVTSLISVVGRSEEGRRLSADLDRLAETEQVVRDRLSGEVARADSLASLPRLEAAAGELGLRQAKEGEFFYVADDAVDTGEGDEAR